MYIPNQRVRSFPIMYTDPLTTVKGTPHTLQRHLHCTCWALKYTQSDNLKGWIVARYWPFFHGVTYTHTHMHRCTLHTTLCIRFSPVTRTVARIYIYNAKPRLSNVYILAEVRVTGL